jgi:hypothetical protein
VGRDDESRGAGQGAEKGVRGVERWREQGCLGGGVLVRGSESWSGLFNG